MHYLRAGSSLLQSLQEGLLDVVLDESALHALELTAQPAHVALPVPRRGGDCRFFDFVETILHRFLQRSHRPAEGRGSLARLSWTARGKQPRQGVLGRIQRTAERHPTTDARMR